VAGDGGQVNWYGEDVMLRIADATQETLDELALVGEGNAKQNIVANNQVDTGFMVNSVYAITSKGHDLSAASGEYANRSGQMVHRDAGDAQSVDEGEAAIACAAEYAIHQEMRNSFLYRALEQLANEAGGVIERVGREQLG
jgi:hypothetical protein